MAVTCSTKWSCPTCTFNNWLSCSKCVLCGSSKPSDDDDVIPRIPVAKYRQQNPGWSKLAPSSNPPTGGTAGSQPPSSILCLDLNTPSIFDSSPSVGSPTSHAHGHTGQQAVKGTSKCKTKAKWACSSCTYLNWPNIGQCSMCDATHVKASRNEESSRLSRSSPSSSYESILGLVSGGAVGGDSTTVGSDVLVHHSSKARSGRNGNRGGGTGGTGGEGKKKWKCQRCTYDNSTSINKCSMCTGPRTRTPTPPLAARAEDPAMPPPTSPYIITHHRHRRRSPPTSLSQAPHPPSPHLPSSHITTSVTPTDCRSRSNNSSSDSCESGKIDKGSVNEAVSGSGSNITPNELYVETGTGPSGGGRDRRVPHSTSLSRQIQLKSDTNEVRQVRNTLSSTDWLFLNACLGIVNNDESAVKAYLRQDGDRARQLNKNECLVLGQAQTFTVGSTLVHLAIRFQRSELLGLLLTPAPSDARKRLPSESNLDLACSIREELSLSLHQHKVGDWPCYYTTQINTFILPAEIRRFCLAVQKRVLDEIVDKDVNRELEAEVGIINWSSELVELGSKLYPLWNRTAGDCLLDSVLQATWGVVDRDSTLRRAMADSLADGESSFYERWKHSEQRLSESQGYTLEEVQLRQDWGVMVTLADQTGRALEQIHVFALAHILRRPIIVYGVRVVKNYRGENLGYANFEGVYLPLLWESAFCWKTPIALAYTRGHFSALVSLATPFQPHDGSSHVTYLPLVDSEGRLLCVHYLSEHEIGCEERLLEEYCECHLTRVGTLTARQDVTSQQQHSLVVSLVDQWLDRFRKMDKRREGVASAATHSDSDHLAG